MIASPREGAVSARAGTIGKVFRWPEKPSRLGGLTMRRKEVGLAAALRAVAAGAFLFRGRLHSEQEERPTVLSTAGAAADGGE